MAARRATGRRGRGEGAVGGAGWEVRGGAEHQAQVEALEVWGVGDQEEGGEVGGVAGGWGVAGVAGTGGGMVVTAEGGRALAVCMRLCQPP